MWSIFPGLHGEIASSNNTYQDMDGVLTGGICIWGRERGPGVLQQGTPCCYYGPGFVRHVLKALRTFTISSARLAGHAQSQVVDVIHLARHPLRRRRVRPMAKRPKRHRYGGPRGIRVTAPYLHAYDATNPGGTSFKQAIQAADNRRSLSAAGQQVQSRRTVADGKSL